MASVDNTLQAIIYERGSLQLLDQRKLPLETIYLEIRNMTDGMLYMIWWFVVHLLLLFYQPSHLQLKCVIWRLLMGHLRMMLPSWERNWNILSQAFELVHENIPATLIVDSAATALMKPGRVSVVTVRADHVAENGNTANKIGTYSLA